MPDDRPPISPSIPLLDGISAVIGRYDALILDLWGVLHNGITPYPGVIQGLTALKAADKQVCLLSNAPRRVYKIIDQLTELGIDAALYDSVLSSGEATWQALNDRADSFHRALGHKCFHIGPPRDDSVHQGLDLTLVERIEDADFVLNTGIDGYDETLDDYRPLLEAAWHRQLPMICANPDLVVVFGERDAICAGLLAQYYEQMGGQVVYHGKPHLPVYHRCLELLANPSPSRVLAVGDSLRTDIAGASAAGIDAVFVIGGIHADALGATRDGTPDRALLDHVIAESGLRPIGAVRRFTW